MLNIFRRQPREEIRVHHGYRDEVGGPFVKLERMNRYFPNYEKGYNLVYGVSGTNLPRKVLDRAKRKKIPVVCHMNSCWHPAYANDYEAKNHLLKLLHNEYAAYVVYGSKQAIAGAERYLGPVQLPHSVIYNAVDTEHFRPVKKVDGPPTILAAGLHQFTHRLKPLIMAMPEIEKEIADVELLIAGKLVSGTGIFDCGKETVEMLIKKSGFTKVRFIDGYSQAEAPAVYAQADVMVHLKHMDWTPNVVAEAMACGVPTVHTGNGGVPEIVQDAGVSLEMATDWDKIHEADPAEVASATVQAYQERVRLGERARMIAKKEFNLESWIENHQQIFQSLI